MKSILYIGVREGLNIRSKELADYWAKKLSTHYLVHLLGNLFDKQISVIENFYDLILVQNSQSIIFYNRILSRLSKCPILFVSETDNLNGYIAPFKNLFGVINIGGGRLSVWGIPEELQLRLNPPVDKVANLYIYEQQPELCRIVYCPTGNSIQESDLKLFTFLRQTNSLLTIISDEYLCLSNALPPFISIVPRSYWFSVYKRAHLVVASGFDAVRAMALCKPCVILGDYGLGGMVTPENFDYLQSVFFRGRKGACFKEMVPLDLLEVEIRKIFVTDRKEALVTVQKKIIDGYKKNDFDTKLLTKIEQTIELSSLIRSRKNKFSLKPQLSSLFSLEESNGKQYLLRGMNCFGEIDDEMLGLLKQCNGSTSINDLILHNGYDNEEASIFWENLYELWKEKLILFVP